MRVIALLIYLALAGVSLARLGDTRERVEARYGLPKREGTPANAAPLLQGAREMIFEHEGFQIRCALLFAKDGEWYIVRKEYRKIWNADVMKKGGTRTILDREVEALLQAEDNGRPWRRRQLAEFSSNVGDSFAKLWLRALCITGTVWTRDDGAVAWKDLGASSLVFHLPQALKYEAELRDSIQAEQKAAAERLAETRQFTLPSDGVTSPPVSVSPEPASTPPHMPMADLFPSSPPPDTPPLPDERAVSQPVAAKPTRSAGDPMDGLIVVAILAMVGIGILKQVLGAAVKGQQKKKRRWNQSRANRSTPPPLPAEVRRRTLEDLTWDEFETLVGEIFRRQGYSVAISAADGADGGIDLDITKGEERVLVQCKHWRNVKVTAKEIREFYGVLISEHATRGIFVTSSGYTRDALEFAAGKPIVMIDRKALEELIALTKCDANDDLLNVPLWAPYFVKGAEVKTPSCQYCRKEMVLRSGSYGRFWGCANYPRCRGKRQARAHLVPR